MYLSVCCVLRDIFIVSSQDCLHQSTARVSLVFIFNISHGLPPPFTAQGLSLFLHIHHQPRQVLCFFVPTHLVHVMLEKQRNLFSVTKAFPTIFSSLLLAKHFCLLSKLLWMPHPFGTHHNNDHIHLISLRSNGYVSTLQFVNNSIATTPKETVRKINLRMMMM